MKKILKAILIGVVLSILIALPVFAYTYQAFLTVTSSNTSTSYSMLPVSANINTLYMASNGFIHSDAMDTRIQNLGGTTYPWMVTDNAVYTALAVSANSQTNLQFTSGNANLTSMSIIPGYGGNVTVASAANLNLGSNFSASYTGFLDTTKNTSFWNQPGSYSFNTSSNGNISFSFNGTSSIILTPNGAGASSGFNLFGAATNWQAAATNDGNTSYVFWNTTAGAPWQDLYTITSLPSSNVSISSVTIHAFMRASGASAMDGSISIGGNITQTIFSVQNNTFSDYSHTWSTSPNTGYPFTVAEIASMQIGVHALGNTYNGATTYVYISVNYQPIVTKLNVSSGFHNITVTASSTNLSIYVDNILGQIEPTATVTSNTSNITLINGQPYATNITLSINGTQQLWYSPAALISGDVLPDRAGGDNPGTINWGTFPVDCSVSFNPSTNLALAPAYTIGAGPGFIGSNLTMSGNYTSTNVSAGGVPGAVFIEDVADSGGTPPIFLYGVLASMFLVLFGLFLSWMERKFGSTMEIGLIRIALGVTVFGMMIAFGKFDWWMLFFYLVIALSVYLYKPPEGSVEQLNLVGFLATSWVGLTLVNRTMEAQFITSTETMFLNNFAFTRSYDIQGIITLPILNLDFVNGLVHLFKWDYSFFGGNAQIIQYFLYSFTLVGSFVIFGMLVYTISGLFFRR